jgi:hypothetical protein
VCSRLPSGWTVKVFCTSLNIIALALGSEVAPGSPAAGVSKNPGARPTAAAVDVIWAQVAKSFGEPQARWENAWCSGCSSFSSWPTSSCATSQDDSLTPLRCGSVAPPGSLPPPWNVAGSKTSQMIWPVVLKVPPACSSKYRVEASALMSWLPFAAICAGVRPPPSQYSTVMSPSSATPEVANRSSFHIRRALPCCLTSALVWFMNAR